MVPDTWYLALGAYTYIHYTTLIAGLFPNIQFGLWEQMTFDHSHSIKNRCEMLWFIHIVMVYGSGLWTHGPLSKIIITNESHTSYVFIQSLYYVSPAYAWEMSNFINLLLFDNFDNIFNFHIPYTIDIYEQWLMASYRQHKYTHANVCI